MWNAYWDTTKTAIFDKQCRPCSVSVFYSAIPCSTHFDWVHLWSCLCFLFCDLALMNPLLCLIFAFVIICISVCCFADKTEDPYADRTYVFSLELHQNSLRKHAYSNTVDSRYLELQGTLWNTSRYPYFDISDLRNWGKHLIEQPPLTEWICNLTPTS